MTTDAETGPWHLQRADRDTWDALLAAAPNATPFHSRAWCEAVSAATGHRLHLLLERAADGSPAGILPLHHVRSPLFGQALVSSGFGVGGGILAGTPAATAALAAAACDLARVLRVPSVEVRGGPLPEGEGWTREEGVYAAFSGALFANEAEQLVAIPRKQRAEVRKGLAGNLKVTTGRSERERSDHYRVYAASVRNLGSPVFPRRLFDAVLDAFGDDADILTVRDGGEAVASVLSLYWRGTVMPYWGGGLQSARRLRANDRMYFALMRHAASRGCSGFDFGRSKTGSGAWFYKKSWGFEPRPLVYARWLAPGARARNTNPASRRYHVQTMVWKKLPLWAANAIGPYIARGLG